MSCKHGNWSDCDECEEINALCREIGGLQHEIERLTKNVECLLLAIGICQSRPDPRDLLNESVAMVSKSLEGKS